MKVSERTNKVLYHMMMYSKTTIKEIQERLQINERAVRYELDNIDDYLTFLNMMPIQKYSKGKLASNPEHLKKVYQTIGEIICTSAEDRQVYIKYKLLMNQNINLAELMHEFDVARNTIRKDVKQIEEELLSKGFVVENHKLSGSTEAINKYIVSNFADYYRILFQCKIDEDYNFRLIEREIICEFRNCNVFLIKEIILKFNIAAAKVDSIMAYVLITIQRIQKGFHGKITTNKNYLRNTEVYKKFQNEVNRIEADFDVEICESDILLITSYITGIATNVQNPIVFESLIPSKIFVKRLIKKVGEDLNIPLRGDERLVDGLIEHLKTMIFRVKNHFLVEDVMYYDAIYAYQDLYQIVKTHISELEELLSENLTREEVALIVVHFIGAIKRYESTIVVKKKVILMCGSGYGTSLVVKNLIETNYEVEVMDTISLYQLVDYSTTGIDYIISTLKVDYEVEKLLSIPLIRISPFLEFDDEVLLKKFNIQRKRKTSDSNIHSVMKIVEENIDEVQSIKIHKQINAYFHEKDNQGNLNLFSNINTSAFAIVDDIFDWTKALNVCGDYLMRNAYIEKGYIDEIFNAIRNFGPYFVIRNEIAMPHGQINNYIKKDGMYILYIRNGVCFPGGKMVKLIFFLAADHKDILLNTVLRINELSHIEDLYSKIENCEDPIEKIRLLTYMKREA